MPQHDVGGFVRHHASQLRFVAGGLDGSQIYVDRPAGKRKGVDLLLIDHVKTVGPLFTRGVRHQLRAQLLHVLGNGIAVGQERKFLVGFGRRLLSYLDFLVPGESIGTAGGLEARLQGLRRCHCRCQEQRNYPHRKLRVHRDNLTCGGSPGNLGCSQADECA